MAEHAPVTLERGLSLDFIPEGQAVLQELTAQFLCTSQRSRASQASQEESLLRCSEHMPTALERMTW